MSSIPPSSQKDQVGASAGSGPGRRTRSSTAGQTSVQKCWELFEQGHTTTRKASSSKTGGSNYPLSSVSKQSAVKADSYTTADVLQLRSDKKKLEQQVKEQAQVIESQLERERADKKQLATAKATEQQLHRQLESAKRDAERIQAEADSHVRSQTERYQRELAKMKADMRRQHDEYEEKLHDVQDDLKKEKKHRKQTEHQLAEMQRHYENEKVRSKQIAERCLTLLRSSRDGHGIFHGHLGISFESPQQERKYQAIALKIIDDLQPNASITLGAQPDRQYDVVFHLARTEGGRTVNLKPSIRQEFKCDNVILVLLRSGKNPDVYSTFVPYDSNEYSGILFGQRGERRVIVQLLHWENECLDCKLNDENIKLLRDLVSQACPRMLEELQEDQLLKALGLQEGQY